eukprot:1677227-Rhodomonas_salina.1
MHFPDLIIGENAWSDKACQVQERVVLIVFKDGVLNAKDPLKPEGVHEAGRSGIVPSQERALQSAIRVRLVLHH